MPDGQPASDTMCLKNVSNFKSTTTPVKCRARVRKPFTFQTPEDCLDLLNFVLRSFLFCVFILLFGVMECSETLFERKKSFQIFEILQTRNYFSFGILAYGRPEVGKIVSLSFYFVTLPLPSVSNNFEPILNL